MIDHLPHGTIIVLAACGLVVAIVDAWTFLLFPKERPWEKTYRH